MVKFQALTWESKDTDDEHLISIFGKTMDGKSVCVTTEFAPYFFIKLPKKITAQRVQNIYSKLERECPERLMSYAIVQSKDIWGFQNNETFKFMQLNFKTLESRRMVSGRLKRALPDETMKFKVYESNIDPVLRVMHRTGIQSTGWLDTGDACIRSHLANVDIDLFCNDWTTLKPVEDTNFAPFVVASVDIECNSSTGKFPDADIKDDCCFQIAISLCTFGSDEPYDKTCLCYKQTDPNLDGCNIISYNTESEMLEAFTKYLSEKDVDIITGWNLFGFDWEYIYKRGIITKCKPSFFEMGKFKDHPCDILYKKLSSSALGANDLKLIPMPGRFIFDLFQEVKKGYKLDSYKLDSVSKEYLGDQKIDMPAKEMFARFVEEDPVKLREVAEYCIKDTLLPHKLLSKLCTLINLLEMAKATWTPLCYLVERGQQIKVYSQLTKKAREMGYMVPTLPYGQGQEQYEGATVLDAQKGAYYRPITALDFEGLYPSIMMAHNLCYSTLVMDPKYGNIPGITYETFGPYKFAQGVPSLLPSILLELKQFRKQAKKDMASATGTLKSMYNGKQLAYKITMNSVYGFTGAGRGILPCVPIASSVTMKGRNMIDETKEYVEKHFPGSKVRYGDSVTGDTPLLIRKNGVISTSRIDSLVDMYNLRSDGKETSLIDAEVWTENGFTPIKQIVRHKTSKNIHRVVTHTGIVDVTADHSLLLKNKYMVKPSEVGLGQELLHGNTKDAFETATRMISITREEAKVLGFFFGDGSCGTYECPSGIKRTWALNNSNMDYLLEMQKLCPFETKIYDTLESSGVYKLCAVGDVYSVVERYRKLFYNSHGEKIVPPCILNAFPNIIECFIEGYYMADGDKAGNRMDCKGKEGSMGLHLLGRILGYNVSINTRQDKLKVLRQTWTKSTQRRNPIAIKKLELLGETDDYVYDLTTESHHFHVGPGELVVHNTDSVMVEFDVGDRKGVEAVEYSWEVGERAAEECTKLFKAPNNLELEKVYYPMFLYSKKRYAAKLWTKGKDGSMNMDYIDIKGLQIVRRDNTPHMREVCKELLDVVLESNDTGPPKSLALERAIELLEGNVPDEKLILSQSLSDTYKSKGRSISINSPDIKDVSMAHVQVVRKMRERQPGSEPQSGDRVPYILIKTDDPKARAFEKSEDPKYAKEHNLSIDYPYYFVNKFLNPVCDLLEPLVDDPKEEIFGELMTRIKPKRRKKAVAPKDDPSQRKITDIFKK